MRTLILMLAIVFPCLTTMAQDKAYQCNGTETNPNTHKYPVVTLDMLKDASNLSDIHEHYPASWVRTYHSVTISSQCHGVQRSAQSENDNLTAEQLEILKTADNDCLVRVLVDYTPENNLKCNPPKQLDFSLQMVPIYEASYAGAEDFIDQYIKENRKEGHTRS